MINKFIRPPISNGNPKEQALIRRWWHETHDAKGEIVWEYYVDGYYIDAIWLKESENHGKENPGTKTATNFPLGGRKITLCEAKIKLTPELVGQGLVYTKLLVESGSIIDETILFCEQANESIKRVVGDLGLYVVEYPAE